MRIEILNHGRFIRTTIDIILSRQFKSSIKKCFHCTGVPNTYLRWQRVSTKRLNTSHLVEWRNHVVARPHNHALSENESRSCNSFWKELYFFICAVVFVAVVFVVVVVTSSIASFFVSFGVVGVVFHRQTAVSAVVWKREERSSWSCALTSFRKYGCRHVRCLNHLIAQVNHRLDSFGVKRVAIYFTTSGEFQIN